MNINASKNPKAKNTDKGEEDANLFFDFPLFEGMKEGITWFFILSCLMLSKRARTERVKQSKVN